MVRLSLTFKPDRRIDTLEPNLVENGYELRKLKYNDVIILQGQNCNIWWIPPEFRDSEASMQLEERCFPEKVITVCDQNGEMLKSYHVGQYGIGHFEVRERAIRIVANINVGVTSFEEFYLIREERQARVEIVNRVHPYTVAQYRCSECGETYDAGLSHDCEVKQLVWQLELPDEFQKYQAATIAAWNKHECDMRTEGGCCHLHYGFPPGTNWQRRSKKKLR